MRMNRPEVAGRKANLASKLKLPKNPTPLGLRRSPLKGR